MLIKIISDDFHSCTYTYDTIAIFFFNKRFAFAIAIPSEKRLSTCPTY